MTIIHWIVSVIAILLAAYLLQGYVQVTILGAIVLAVVLGIINLFLKPVIRLLTLPINILTLGLFSLVVNALLIMLADLLIPGFSVSSFWGALLFGIAFALINGFFNMITAPKAG